MLIQSLCDTPVHICSCFRPLHQGQMQAINNMGLSPILFTAAYEWDTAINTGCILDNWQISTTCKNLRNAMEMVTR